MRRADNMEVSRYAAFGLAAALPGMQLAVDTLQAQLNDMRNQLAALQNGDTSKRRGRPRNDAPQHSQEAKSGWSADPEERRAEMMRRRKKWDKNKATHPRDPLHPGHADWLTKMRKGAKKHWSGMTVAQRKERLGKMVASRKKKAVPLVKLEATA